MKYKILIAPFPFGDLTTAKNRPVLCLSEPIGPYDEVILAYITSRISNRQLKSDVVLKTAEQGFLQTKLLMDSTIRLHKLFTMPKSMIIGELGELPKNKISEVQTKIRQLL
jgi:mRNA interferase MazF